MFCLTLSGTVFALTTPEIVQDHGVITGMVVSSDGLKLDGEYGLTPEVALIGTIGDSYTRIGGKYQFDRALAILGGFTEDSPFIGINASRVIKKDLIGICEFDLLENDDDLSLFYELGVKLNLEDGIDLRGGLIGFIDNEDSLQLELGVGYKF